MAIRQNRSVRVLSGKEYSARVTPRLDTKAKDHLRALLERELPGDCILLHNDELLEDFGVRLLRLMACSAKEQLRKKACMKRDPLR